MFTFFGFSRSCDIFIVISNHIIISVYSTADAAVAAIAEHGGEVITRVLDQTAGLVHNTCGNEHIANITSSSSERAHAHENQPSFPVGEPEHY